MPGKQVAERPPSLECQIGEVWGVVPSADPESDPVPLNGGEMGNHVGEDLDGRRRRLGLLPIADLDKERGEVQLGTVVRRFKGRGQTDAVSPFRQCTESGRHAGRVRANERPRTTTDLRGFARVSQRMDREAGNVALTAVDGGVDEGRSGHSDRLREERFEVVVMDVESRPAEHQGEGGEGPDCSPLDMVSHSRRGTPPTGNRSCDRVLVRDDHEIAERHGRLGSGVHRHDRTGTGHPLLIRWR